jgi:hypothetical protein
MLAAHGKAGLGIPTSHTAVAPILIGPTPGARDYLVQGLIDSKLQEKDDA